mmetsp:Transcript_20671/g.27229  ORF Transcript_20671/g.27229 Transcript_20671/m.27229 type:complete len:346 (+) Transcript_20671:53-1090(+)
MWHDPRHLILLVHGLDGAPGDLNYLADQLKAKLPMGDTMVVCAKANHGRTKDGVAAGGLRLAAEIRGLVKAHVSLDQLSIIGNSLGGLYSRYALAHLNFNPRKRTFLGRLAPRIFMTIATPHLGVRNFTFIPVPSALHPLAGVLFGQSGKDLFLKTPSRPRKRTLTRYRPDFFSKRRRCSHEPASLLDETPLLLLMATEDKYLHPLKAFDYRRLYANLSKDMMVPLGTAAFQPDFANGREIQLQGSSKGSAVKAFKCTTSKVEGGNEASDVQKHFIKSEDKMAYNLDNCGWEKIGIRFPGFIPDSHNRVCAWSRWKIGAWLYKSGRVVMDDAVAFFHNTMPTSSS